MPRHPTLAAFGRASTLSLGSIAFGSLIVTLLELLRIILNAARQNASQDGNREHFAFRWFEEGPTRIAWLMITSCRGLPGVVRGVLCWVHREHGAVLQQICIHRDW